MKTLAYLLLWIPAAWAVGQPESNELSRTIRENPRAEVVLPLLPRIHRLLADDNTAVEALPIVEQSAEILRAGVAENGAYAVTASLLKIAARMRFEQAEPDKAIKHVQALHEMYRALWERLPPPNAARQQLRWSDEVALEYLRGDQLKEALAVLGDRVDREAQFTTEQLPPAFEESTAAVSGALHRRLEQLDTNERFNLLYAWSMPTEARRTVRVLCSLASVEAPPDVFARSLGERPRANAFPIPQIGGVDGLFCTASSLVQAAAQSGRLRRLSAELDELVKAKVPNAEFVLLLARMADESSGEEPLRALIDKRLETLGSTANPPAPAGQTAPPLSFISSSEGMQWIVIGAACLDRQALRGSGQRVFEKILELNADSQTHYSIPMLRKARAVAILKQHEGADPQVLVDPGLKFWIPASEENATRSATGAVREIWLMHEDHIMHVAGPYNDYLCFRYPLTGDFEFHVEAQNGGKERTFGNVAFGGLAFGVAGNADELRVWGLDMGQMLKRPFPFVRKEQWATYQRLELKSTDQGIVHVINGHPAWTDSLRTSTSPWLALRCFGEYIPAYRNFRLSGKPVIPREVRMSDGELLRGWFTQFYPTNFSPAVPVHDVASAKPPANSASSTSASPSPSEPPPHDWFIHNGIIQGANRGEPFRAAVPSRLTYFRPLQSDESIQYEFLYEPGKYEVHPGLGRMAFLVEPNGVRVRWMTSGDTEWTGLAENNATVEPLNRRGPRPLPLKARDWNRITMSLRKDVVSLALNDVEIYSRKMEPENSRRFSLYHDRNRSAVQVRNVVLRGDWPEKLSEEDLKNLLAPREGDQATVAATHRGTLGTLFGETHMSDSALAVHRKAMELAPDQRFALLEKYVLPGMEHHQLRLAIDFTANNPAAQVMDRDAIDDIRLAQAGQDTKHARLQIGGNLVSPAMDLIETARQLGRLDELRERVAAAPKATPLEQRQRLAMLTLVDIARADVASANEQLFQLIGLLEQGTQTSFAERWPETLAAFAALREPATRNAGGELVVLLHLRQGRNGADSGSEAWRRHIASWVGLSRHFEDPERPDLAKFTLAPPLSQWKVVDHQTALTRGRGFPRTHWAKNGSGVDILSRHDDDFLFFQSPLHGNYEVECEVPAFGWRDSQVLVGGEWLSVRSDLKSFHVGTFRHFSSRTTVTPPLVKPEEIIRYRVVVRDRFVKLYANGRLLRERALAPHADPWVAIRSDTPGLGGAKKLWILGQPEIPESIQLTVDEELGSWLSYFEPPRTGDQGNWRYEENLDNASGLVGPYRPDLYGLFAESLIRYHRPMLEDGVIEYEFYYDGQNHCHPALDRLAFLLEPGGVRVHWVTDGNYDRSTLNPDNAIDEPEHRRGPTSLPLMSNAWNRLTLTLQGDTVQLSLNGQQIYERPLELTNQRTFGLFHYVDQTGARVRNMVWKGSWPRELPGITRQELAGVTPVFLDEGVSNLSASFLHDFRQSGFPSDKFSMVQGPIESFVAKPDGLHIDRRGEEGYRNATFSPRLNLHGDFDVTATYEQLQSVAPPDGSALLMLMAILSDETKTECATMWRHALPKRGTDERFHQTMFVQKFPTGERRNYSKAIASETTSGRLRLARRGKTIYYLLAEGDSPMFRLVRSEELSNSDIAEGNLRVVNQTHGPGRVQLVWTSLSIRAEKLSGTATEERSQIVAQLNRERAALPVRFAHDFTLQQITSDRFLHWGFEPASRTNAGGLIVTGPPSDKWSSAGASPRMILKGDFDVSFDFALLRMTQPKAGMYSDVFLQVELPDPAQTQYNMMLVRATNGEKYAQAQLREMTTDRKLKYSQLGRDPIDHISRLRVARRGSQAYFLFSRDGKQPDELIARHSIPTMDIPATLVRIMVHTGGTGTVTETAWKSISIHAR